MPIYFYSEREQPYGVFSNFSPHGFIVDGRYYPTSEHYFQAQKFVDSPDDYEAIATARKPKIAADRGRERSRPLRSDWNAVKDDVMRIALRAKFDAHTELRELLLSTGTETLIEKTSTDYYWGCGTDGTGKNRLGELLEKLRETYRVEPAV
ncbi:MAG: NADAR family protein [Armatimonadetes bacterium]|nr:NADAR family protein [Armatimonadota bacterium]